MLRCSMPRNLAPDFVNRLREIGTTDALWIRRRSPTSAPCSVDKAMAAVPCFAPQLFSRSSSRRRNDVHYFTLQARLWSTMQACLHWDGQQELSPHPPSHHPARLARLIYRV